MLSLELIVKIAVVIIGLLSLVLSIFVFKFNFKKDSFSKISLKPLKVLSMDDSTKDRTKKSLTDLEYINDMNDEDVHFKKTEKGYSYRFGSRNGFCNDTLLHEMYDWVIEIENRGAFPSTNIEIEYEILIKKLNVFSDEDGMNGFQMIPECTVKRSIKIDYMAADDKKKIFVTTLNGEFPQAFISVLSLRSSEMKFIKKRTQIDSYIHPKLTNSANINSALFLEMAGISIEEIASSSNNGIPKRTQFYAKKEKVSIWKRWRK